MDQRRRGFTANWISASYPINRRDGAKTTASVRIWCGQPIPGADSLMVRAVYRSQDKKPKKIVNNRLATARLASMLGKP